MRLAGDANVLLAAVLRGRAKLVLEHPSVKEVIVTEETLPEVEEYAYRLAAKRGFPGFEENARHRSCSQLYSRP